MLNFVRVSLYLLSFGDRLCSYATQGCPQVTRGAIMGIIFFFVCSLFATCLFLQWDIFASWFLIPWCAKLNCSIIRLSDEYILRNKINDKGSWFIYSHSHLICLLLVCWFFSHHLFLNHFLSSNSFYFILKFYSLIFYLNVIFTSLMSISNPLTILLSFISHSSFFERSFMYLMHKQSLEEALHPKYHRGILGENFLFSLKQYRSNIVSKRGKCRHLKMSHWSCTNYSSSWLNNSLIF